MASCAATTPEKLSGFEPSLWGDFFIRYEPKPLQRSEEWMRVRSDKLKEDAQLLFKTSSNLIDRMLLVDVLQHLGIDRHFTHWINTVLFEILVNDGEFNSSSLHEVALRFRLLREHGYWVSPGVFDKFKDKDGRLGKNTADEPRGLLSLYNAPHLVVPGEQILEEAITSTRHRLELMMGSLNPTLVKQVKRSLHLPLPRTFKRVETVHYISEYQEEDGHNPTLLELAKVDFNLLQHINLKELKSITKWWKNLSGYVRLSYVRDRVVECYLWAYVVFYEDEYEVPRSILAKINVLLTMIDDTYDIHATIEDCRKLHEAIQRWDETSVSLLPEYLKKFYVELMRNLKEIGNEMEENVNYDIAYLRKQFQNQFTYYLQEAEWSHQKHKPSFEDHVNLTALTVGVPTVCVGLMAGMDDAIMNGSLKWALGIPDVVLATGKIARFMNDIASYKRGKCKGDVANSVECYINDHGVTKEVAFAMVDSLVEDEWKILNQGRFGSRALLPAVLGVINLGHNVPLMYHDRNDAFTFSKHLKKTIDSLFVEPIPI